MPAVPITYQTRPQKWTDDVISDALNSFQFGLLMALDLLNSDDHILNLPGFTFTATTETPSQIINNTPSHGEPYPDPIQKKWLRNRGRLAVSATSFVKQGLWPTPIIRAAAHRTGTTMSMSPKLALALIGVEPPTALRSLHTSGLSPYLDRIAASQGIGYEDHGVRTSNDRKFPNNTVRELVRVGRRPGAALPPFAVRLLRHPARSLMVPDEENAYAVKPPAPASWLYETSLLTGVPVTAFIRYAETEYFDKGVTYVDKLTLRDLIQVIYEADPLDHDDTGSVLLARELEDMMKEVELPEGEYW